MRRAGPGEPIPRRWWSPSLGGGLLSRLIERPEAPRPIPGPVVNGLPWIPYEYRGRAGWRPELAPDDLDPAEYPEFGPARIVRAFTGAQGHGTEARARRHYRDRERPCESCRLAMNRAALERLAPRFAQGVDNEVAR